MFLEYQNTQVSVAELLGLFDGMGKLILDNGGASIQYIDDRQHAGLSLYQDEILLFEANTFPDDHIATNEIVSVALQTGNIALGPYAACAIWQDRITIPARWERMHNDRPQRLVFAGGMVAVNTARDATRLYYVGIDCAGTDDRTWTIGLHPINLPVFGGASIVMYPRRMVA